jgi:D-apionolactonase
MAYHSPPGSARAQPVLTAGPFAARLDGADLVDVCLGDIRVISRLGVRVRDPAWGTVPGEVRDVAVDSDASAFAIGLTSRHRGEGIDVEWQGAIAGAATGELTFAMDAIARADSAYARIGLVALHAAPVTAGRPYRTRGGGGQRAGRLPALVGPQLMDGNTVLPLFTAFTALDLDLEAGPTLRMQFDGDMFEMEDQRNWSDGSFKTYSTPVGLPIPHRIRAGESLRQRVRVEAAGPPLAARRRRAPTDHTIDIGKPTELRLPAIGLGLDDDRHQPTVSELDALRGIAAAHLRVRLMPAQAPEVLVAAARIASALDAGLELAVTLDGEDPVTGLDALAATLDDLDVEVARLIVLRAGARVSSARDVAMVAASISGAPALVTGTDGAFADLNRERPPAAALAYPIMPQVHETDDVTLAESLAASGDTVATAREFAPGAPVHVTPITLGPRSALADPRQATGVAAAWTVGSIHRLARAGAASMTYFELTGRGGVIERENRGCRPFAVYDVLAQATRARGARLLDVRLEDPLAVEALAVLGHDGPRALIANVRSEPMRVTVTGAIERTLRLEPWSVALATGS